MSIHVALHHKTSYHYDRFVGLGPHVIRLRPAPHSKTRVLSYSLRVEPQVHFLNWQQDPNSNYLARLVFPEKTDRFVVEVDLVAEMAVFNPFDYFLEEYATKFPFKYDPDLAPELEPFLKKLPLDGRLAAFVNGIDRSQQPTNDFLVQLNRLVHQRVGYVIRLEAGVQTPDETLTLGQGSCRDSAWLLVQCLRHCGLAARFCSGYLIQLKPDLPALDGPSGAEQDFTDLHAWAEVYLPGAGWIGLDPTSGLLAGEGHIPLACTPEPQGAAPISGTLDDAQVEFGFEMSLQRIREAPRVTLPFSDAQWARVESLGDAIDADLVQHDVRLSMGGEPTFVSIDDMDGPEWNLLAMGPNKRRLADTLVQRLMSAFAPGALLHRGQGKWYPGEPLPRWAFNLYWRKDGEPIWEDPSLFADETVQYGFTEHDSGTFLSQIAERLDLDPKFVVPGYEDAWFYLWRERRLPTNVDPFESKLEDEMERARLARIFEQGLDRCIGHALPLQRVASPSGCLWQTGSFFLRAERLYLMPGDSPMGYRLPLDSFPWIPPSDYPYIIEEDPTLQRPPLPSRRAGPEEWGRRMPGTVPQVVHQARHPGESDGDYARRREEEQRRLRERQERPAPQRGESGNEIVRTALCVEPREGRIHVFIPPLARLEDYLELIGVIEDTAADLRQPVTIEGYNPPHDSRIEKIGVTPDPGVIEVNIHPSTSWSQLVHNTTTLYEEARQTRLGTEKFMLDGRHSGTGGGNHIVLGGATPLDSPFLRRPDLLKSLIAYWHNHPSLSYLFSGLFIGPTCQAPRMDEARNDSLFEMELAFRQIPGPGESVSPWLVDRIFRNLLIDVSGNTHRAEFCIDKLFSPDSSTGRLGLLEMRSFEMPPHARMSLAQQLLLRGLVSRFWQHPYQANLVRWGTQLHDRFMLPHFVWDDFRDVLDELVDFGYPFDPEWFQSHLAFRFPHYGSVAHRNIELELRHALEPWHVLGEEGAAGGNVRYVDSSVERVQIKVLGLVDSRHVILCNGERVPLHPTGTVGEFVAGVRYRAWQPPSCLHPTIGIDSPLTFDIIDTWNDRSLGGCCYHVTHPGGRTYATFPVNSYEAESRRLSRFWNLGHSAGRVSVPPSQRDADFPFTLDLRKS